MKLPHTEVKFDPKVKSQTGLSSLRVSRKRARKNQDMRCRDVLFLRPKSTFT